VVQQHCKDRIKKLKVKKKEYKVPRRLKSYEWTRGNSPKT